MALFVFAVVVLLLLLVNTADVDHGYTAVFVLCLVFLILLTAITNVTVDTTVPVTAITTSVIAGDHVGKYSTVVGWPVLYSGVASTVVGWPVL